MKKQRKFAWVDKRGLNQPEEFYPSMERGDNETRIFAQAASEIDKCGWSLVLGSEYSIQDLLNIRQHINELLDKFQSTEIPDDKRGMAVRFWVAYHSEYGFDVVRGDEKNPPKLADGWRFESVPLETKYEAEKLIKEWTP